MNSNKAQYVLSLFFVLIRMCCYGQETWDLNRCLEYAQQNHPILLQSENNVQKSRLNVKNAYNAWFPTAQASLTTNIENIGISQSNSFQKQLFLEVPFDLLNWKNLLMVSWQKLYQQNAVYQMKGLRLEQGLRIVKAFYQYQYDRSWQVLLESQIKGIEEQIVRIEKEVSIGNRAKSDIYDAKANFGTIKEQWFSAVNQQQLTKNELQNAIGIFDSKIEFVLSEQEDVKRKIIKLDTDFFEHLPVFKVYQNQTKIARKNLQLAQADYLPRLSASYNYGLSNQIANHFQQTNGFKLGFEIPIFNGFQTKNKIAVAKLEIRNTILDKERLCLDLKRDFQNLESQYNVALSKLEMLHANFENQKLSFQKSEEKYRQGMMDSYTFFVVRTAWLQSNFNLIKSKYDVQMQNEILSLYMDNM